MFSAPRMVLALLLLGLGACKDEPLLPTKVPLRTGSGSEGGQGSASAEVPPTPSKPKVDPKRCERTVQEIERTITSSVACKADLDCQAVELGCPFGCKTPINASADLPSLRAKVDDYNRSCPRCEHKCGKGQIVPKCENGKCVLAIDTSDLLPE